jgi:outer membrane protein, heavy metal efflux system
MNTTPSGGRESGFQRRPAKLPLAAWIAAAALVSLLRPAGAPAQAPATANMPQHQHGGTPKEAEFPKLGRAQANATGPLLTLDQALQVAREGNPTLRQAEAGVRAARARVRQAGLYPNPVVGYAGDEIRGGESGGGKQGLFVEQKIVTAGKLGRARDVLSKEVKLAEIEAEEQKMRVETSVKMAFYRVLAVQEMADARGDLARIAREVWEADRRLKNTGQIDETELLSAEVEFHRAQLSARMMENTLREQWRELASVVGRPDLPMATAAGDLEHGWPQIDEQQIQIVAAQGPANRIASAAGERAAAELERVKHEKIPDIAARAGFDYSHEPLGNPSLPTGWQFNAQLALELPLFNRNQGEIAAARADIDRSEAEKQRVGLTLRQRAASAFDRYSNARLMAGEYRDEILPLARKSYRLLSDRYGEMQASYPRVLESKRKLFELQSEYIASLETLWRTGLALEGFLLTDGLEPPTSPGEVDRTIRETNLPSPERTRPTE